MVRRALVNSGVGTALFPMAGSAFPFKACGTSFPLLFAERKPFGIESPKPSQIMQTSLFTVLVLTALLVSSCRESEPLSPNVRTFQVQGVIHEVNLDRNVLIIDHEEIPDYMRAMIMPFRVKNLAEVEGLQPGDVVQFTYIVEELSSWIENVTPTGEKRDISESTLASHLPDTEHPLLSEGDELPDYEFLDESGATVKLSQYRGQPVAMTFVFTRCPVPELCPAMMRNFAEICRKLEEDADAPDQYRLLTISFDTWNDTPETMKPWAAAFGHEPGQPWSLLTSETCCTINAIGANVGLKFGEINGSYQHNLRTVILNPDGTIRKIYTDESWTIPELVSEIKAAADPTINELASS